LTPFEAHKKMVGHKFQTLVAVTAEEVSAAVAQLRVTPGPALLEIKVRLGARKDLGRPKTSPVENKKDFMHFLAISK